MRKTLKAELYVLRHDRVLLCMLVLFFLFALVIYKAARPMYGVELIKTMPMAELNRLYHTDFSTMEAFLQWHNAYVVSPERWFLEIIREGALTVFLGLIFPVFFIGRSFTRRTIHLPLYTGTARGAVFAAKILLFFAVSICYLLLTIVGAQFILGKGWPLGLSAEFVALRILLRLLLDLAVLSVPMMLAFLFGDFLKSLCASVIYVFVLYFGVRFIDSDAWRSAVSWLPHLLVSTLAEKPGTGAGVALTTGRAVSIAAISVGLIGLTTFISWLSFRKRELK